LDNYQGRSDPNSANKLHAVEKFPVPKRVKDAIFGLAGYYPKFIEDFSKITIFLTKLTKKGKILLGGRTTKFISVIKGKTYLRINAKLLPARILGN